MSRPNNLDDSLEDKEEKFSHIVQVGPTDIRSISNSDKGDILRKSVQLSNLRIECLSGIDWKLQNLPGRRRRTF